MAIAYRLPDVSFVVVGTSIKDLTNLSKTFMVPDNVQLVGKILDDNLLGFLYKRARCILCPIRYPGLSTRVHEALFYRRPTIMTKTTADSYGGLVDGKHCMIEENFAKWPAQVHRIVHDEYLRERLEEGAESYYTEVFSPQRHALILEQILNYVVEN
jgi:glycosyltransferase involved in cell wall biosynthesis